MAASKDGLFDDTTRTKILDSKLLVVGAGGIGCELLKNLVLTGFKDIHVIDMDTIDVSNLNRQFLFQKRHIGQSKAVVAKESAQKFNPQASIISHHKSILSSEFGVDFFQQFNAVTNALDNRAARSHVNRMCLAADIPLVESGSAGYLGQVTVHKKGITECYDCVPKGRQKAFAGCTIRNTPSEPIHCVVWAKHLFNQLFGEEDADEDVSPDTADPEARVDHMEGNSLPSDESGNVQRISTREWAKSSNYDPAKLFQKLFYDDIQYLLTMENLWEKRRKPIPLDWMKLPDAVAGSSQQTSAAIKDQELWSIKECAAKFKDSISFLKNKPEDQNLVWDKDDNYCMDFVASCANIRAYCFGIPQKSRFDIKSMAGNIIPAIATTNAIIAGLIVLQLIKLLRNQTDQCRTVYLNKQPNPKKKLLVPCQLVAPKSDCSICSPKPEVSIKMNVQTLTLKTLDEKILKEELCMIAPDVVIDDATGTILISSDGDTDDIKHKTLGDFGLTNGSRLKCEDFHQHCFFILTIAHCENLKDGVEFEVIGDRPPVQPEDDENMESAADDSINDISVAIDVEDDDIIEETTLKRKSEDKSVSLMPAKKKARSYATIVDGSNDEL